ncbi:hypothetical protein ASPVEDRAFT_500446 [Aspergillus versicolor CBS 583.65]|uniref:Uncharacterized protein n=1 Tax=Aspergillus versicolor CBS 583.65 TaxID=1036611 RepID=A0A1L9PCD6_ASPVE|nr:uncharacterized protein ASPVEDRAFT_500446 [Aspergillus versicolor CBS 583.65]OJI99114.1 hypothetical protein ASPVEDRAFT_500446 [Aspergillus versicolor CBS 583.65]
MGYACLGGLMGSGMEGLEGAVKAGSSSGEHREISFLTSITGTGKPGSDRSGRGMSSCPRGVHEVRSTQRHKRASRDMGESPGAILVLARRHDGRAVQQFHRCRIVVSQPSTKKLSAGKIDSFDGFIDGFGGEGWLLLPRSNGRRGPEWWCHSRCCQTTQTRSPSTLYEL